MARWASTPGLRLTSARFAVINTSKRKRAKIKPTSASDMPLAIANCRPAKTATWVGGEAAIWAAGARVPSGVLAAATGCYIADSAELVGSP